MPEIVFLKLGGSLITDKTRAQTARLHLIRRLAAEVSHALAIAPRLRLVLGHGSGSFGHAAAQAVGYDRNQPRTGPGFARVAWAAAALNKQVAGVFHDAGIPLVVLPPSVSAAATNGALQSLSLAPFQRALEQALVPLTYGDVVWDNRGGWTIASTETIFTFLARALQPRRIILAGEVPGVLRYDDSPASEQLVAEITPQTWPSIRPSVHGARGMDVTGGMASKVEDALNLVTTMPGLQVDIISGLEPGRVEEALIGERPVPGTRIRAGTAPRSDVGRQ